MASKKRKRSNPRKKKERVKAKKEKVTEYQKGTIYDEFPVQTLSQTDANNLKEIFELSNNVAALIRDYAEKNITVKKMRLSADILEKEKEPLMLQIAKNLYKTERNYKKIAKDIREQANIIEKQLILVKGQIAHRYEDYVGALIRHKRMVEDVIQTAKLKTITGHRSDEKTKADEEAIFEKDFDKMDNKDINQLKEFNKAIKKSEKE